LLPIGAANFSASGLKRQYNDLIVIAMRHRRSLNLEHIDAALIDRAEHEIDLAAYVLTDRPVMQALTRAADRGVKVRIYLDATQLAERSPPKVFNELAETPTVEIRTKHKPGAPMHLKSY